MKQNAVRAAKAKGIEGVVEYVADMTLDTVRRQMLAELFKVNDNVVAMPFEWKGRLALSANGFLSFVREPSHTSMAETIVKLPHGALRRLKNGELRLTLTFTTQSFERIADVMVDETCAAAEVLYSMDNSKLKNQN